MRPRLAIFFLLALAPAFSLGGELSTSECLELFEPRSVAGETHAVPVPKIAAPELLHALGENIYRVKEFDFIRRIADEEGVRVWLFGGSASAYAHYVKWNLLRLKGDTRFQPDRFGFDYSDIFRSNQDADLVLDGPADRLEAAATRIEKELLSVFNHLQGSKSVWEVRFLKKTRGDKGAILDDWDFLNQHSDSNSTGLIEITEPKAGEPRLRDVRDWNSKEPAFLTDVLEGRLHFYFSENHWKTSRAKEGKNPEIFSVVRGLIKAFQYELEISGNDLARVKKIIDGFNPASILQNYYTAKWMENNATKLIENAVNIEYAVNELERLGLRKKLIAVQNNAEKPGSMAWWLSRKPLESFPLGRGTGQTAKELELDIVAHETNTFLAYESITRAHTGEANVLTSRQGFTGEAAYFGEGFYVKVGTKGARNTGITIRFHLDERAREGTDFIYFPERGYVVIKNKKAIRVIPESLKVDPVYYFELLAGKHEIDESDKGLLEKLRRRVSSEIGLMSQEDEVKISELVSENLRNERLRAAWLSLPISRNHSDLSEILGILEKLEKADPKAGFESFLNQHLPEWLVQRRRDPKLVKGLLASYPELLRPAIERILEEPEIDPTAAAHTVKTLRQVFRTKDVREIVEDLEKLQDTLKNQTPALADSIEKVFSDAYVGSLYGNGAELGRTLHECLNSPDKAVRRFGRAILGQELPEHSPLFKVLSAYREIEESVGEKTEEKIESWLTDEKTKPESKAAFLESELGSGAKRFKTYFALIPSVQHERVQASLEDQSLLPLFMKFARKDEISTDLLLDHAKVESFEFQEIVTKAQAEAGGVTFWMGEGKEKVLVTLDQPYEIQRAPFTQLQALLATGKNQSYFVNGGLEIKIGNRTVKLNPNKPAEQYSWHDMQEIIDVLNELDPKHHYRRPTEAEWEYAARGNTSTGYSHGESEEELKYYGWAFENSGNETHDVVGLKPNPFGLYDMHGNVWEWVEDAYQSTLPGGKNPKVLSGSYRVLRGGSWYNLAEGLRSAFRGHIGSGSRYRYIGFRLVRTAR